MLKGLARFNGTISARDRIGVEKMIPELELAIEHGRERLLAIGDYL